MDDPRRISTRRAVLSYSQVREMNLEWTDLMMKYYQGILQDFAFTADELDGLEVRVQQNEEAIVILDGRIDDLELRVDDLEYRVYKNVSTATSLTTGQFQIILCKNTAPINITLKSNPLDGDEVSIIRTNAIVRIIGPVNKKTNLTLNTKGSGPKLVYDATDLTWWRI